MVAMVRKRTSHESHLGEKKFSNCSHHNTTTVVANDHCARTSEESGTIGGRKRRGFLDPHLTKGKHLPIELAVKTNKTKHQLVTTA